MKKLMVLPLALVAALSFAGPAVACGGDAACTVCSHEPAKGAKAPVKGEMVTVTYKIDAKKWCDKCVKGVSATLADVAGVSKVDVSLAEKTATVTHVKGQADLAKLNAALGGHFKLVAAAAGAKATTESHEGHDHGAHGEHH